MSNNANRIYEAGRSTQGWKKGARVRDVKALTTGTLFIEVNHNFQSENLTIVTEQRPHLPGVWASWADEDGRRTSLDEFCIHEFMLEPIRDKEAEFFAAVPIGTASTKDAVLVIELRYPDYEVYGSQQTATYEREVSFATREEAEVARDKVQEEIRAMSESEQNLLRVYLQSRDVLRGDPLEALRETAGYFVWSSPLEALRQDPYWGRFPEEDLERYQETGSKLA